MYEQLEIEITFSKSYDAISKVTTKYKTGPPVGKSSKCNESMLEN